ncbi:MAG: histidine kinase dimerization/phosphoacceptor domain-containing protein, partial [Saprospiraceae bacterium]
MKRLKSEAGFSTRDTNAFHLTNLRFQAEVSRKGELNLDSFRLLGNIAIQESKKTNYEKGLIEIYLGLGSGYVYKAAVDGAVDSAKFYYSLAINQAAAIRDTSLLSKAYSGYGWTLVYDHSDYRGAIDTSLMACSLAKATNDTALLIEANTKLVKIYFEASKLLEAFKLCTDLQHLCEIRKDTIAQINNYYMFGSIYARMNLFKKQMSMVYKGQELNTKKNDTSFLYTINLTASNGHLFKHQYDSVLYYSRLNLAYCEHLNLMPNCYANIAKAYLETNQLDSARYYYELIMDYHHIHSTYIDTYLYLDLGRIEYKSGNMLKALKYYKKAEADISKPSLPTQADIYKTLYEYYDDQQKIEPALHYLKKYKTWSDSISNQQYGMSVVAFESSLLKEQNQLLSTEKEYESILAEKQRNEKNIALVGTALVFMLIVFGFNWYRKQRSLKHNQMLMTERLRISRELHDEVGAALSGIAMYSHVATEQLKNEKTLEVQHSLSFMQKSAGEMVNKLSDIVWLINPEQDTIIEIFGRLGEYAKKMTLVRNMQIRIDLPTDLAGKHVPLE